VNESVKKQDAAKEVGGGVIPPTGAPTAISYVDMKQEAVLQLKNPKIDMQN
jgi:hypothetical protein